jgi:hypothetical protein
MNLELESKVEGGGQSTSTGALRAAWTPGEGGEMAAAEEEDSRQGGSLLGRRAVVGTRDEIEGVEVDRRVEEEGRKAREGSLVGKAGVNSIGIAPDIEAFEEAYKEEVDMEQPREDRKESGTELSREDGVELGYREVKKGEDTEPKREAAERTRILAQVCVEGFRV